MTISTAVIRLDPALLKAMKDNGILYDRDGDGEFFQIYTHAFEERFFFEIVQRRGYRGFGAPNAGIRLAAQTREARPRTMPRSDNRAHMALARDPLL